MLSNNKQEQYKPINVEAQRVQKVIQDTVRKLQVLSLLNEDFFVELRKSDEEVINHFGPKVGRVLIKHAQLEEDFTNNCLDVGKMIPLDDEDTTEEQRKTILDLQVTTSRIVRIFTTDQEMYHKLQTYTNTFKINSGEFTAFIDTIGNLDELMQIKLSTPKEEVDQVRKNQKILQDKVTKLQEQYDTKKDAYDKYIQECDKSKELRDANIKALSEQINNIKAQKEQHQKDILKQDADNRRELEETHKNTMKTLTDKRNKLDAKMKELEKQNGAAEREDRKNFVKVFQDYHNNMNQYDSEMTTTVTENKKYQGEYEDTVNELKEFQAELTQRLEERRKRDEISAIMQKKKDEQNAKIEKMSRACEWIQAHWRGMLARKEMEKARKGKKKKKKKK